MTTRRLMIIVASIALAFGIATEILRQRRVGHYLGLASIELRHSEQALASSDELDAEAVATPDPRRAAQCRSMARWNRRWATYTTAMARWYVEAASRPWPCLSGEAPAEPEESYAPSPPGSPLLK